ncbi:hypothetical protein Y1Q_0016743 [Alligator mississippiensis]|uniref:Uncharacterized protein n=1 Tax=Alligator mississippiensis TaxID=8496 RepID=A0A151P5T0_ALLMI|nr:hypothetical protein Y1Q_0016743 [Alligator mississippiensis]
MEIMYTCLKGLNLHLKLPRLQKNGLPLAFCLRPRDLTVVSKITEQDIKNIQDERTRQNQLWKSQRNSRKMRLVLKPLSRSSILEETMVFTKNEYVQLWLCLHHNKEKNNPIVQFIVNNLREDLPLLFLS